MDSILNTLQVDSTWTLFLDRDGVINKHLPNDYVKTWDDFIFIEGSIDAINRLAKIFGRIIIVTNQQGIGKGLMSESDLKTIHDKMLTAINNKGRVIDAIYHAPDLVINDINKMRKPNKGMALKAKSLFPQIDFTKSIMVGDSDSDMEFGKNMRMVTILVNKGKPQSNNELFDFEIESLSVLV